MSQTATIDRRSAVVAGFLVVVTLMVAIVGSGNLKWFDAALIGYLFGTLFAVFGVAYRYLVWLQRPPTARLNRRGWEAFRQKGRRGANAVALPGLPLDGGRLARAKRRRGQADFRDPLPLVRGLRRRRRRGALPRVPLPRQPRPGPGQ